MQSFDLVRASDRPAAVAEGAASHTAQQGASVRFLAGGTTLVDLMKLGVERPDRVVDINRLGLDGIHKQANGDLFIGATARNSDLAHHPLVREQLCRAFASYPGRSVDPVAQRRDDGGQSAAAYALHVLSRPRQRLQQATPGSGCPAIAGANRMLAILGTSEACIASHPSDMAVAMMAYDAVVHVQGVSGDRQIPLMDFYVLPQQRPDIETVLAPGDLVTHVTLPPPPAGERSTYLKLRDRASYEFALVSAAAAVTLSNGVIASARFALGGVGTRPWRVSEAERALVGQAPSEAAFRKAAEICLKGARPQSQNGFKVELAKRCIVHAFKQITH